jgi:hypothetical protein
MTIASFHYEASNDNGIPDRSTAVFTAAHNEDEPAPKPPFKGSLRPFKRKEYKPNQPGQDHGNRLVEPPSHDPSAPRTSQP